VESIHVNKKRSYVAARIITTLSTKRKMKLSKGRGKVHK